MIAAVRRLLLVEPWQDVQGTISRSVADDLIEHLAFALGAKTPIK